MTLISIILVVLIERTFSLNQYFHYKFYFAHYQKLFQQKIGFNKNWQAEQYLLVWVAIPVLLVVLVAMMLSGSTLGWLFNIAILYLCFGCPAHRQAYKQYLAAASRDDKQACLKYAEQLSQGFSSKDDDQIQPKADLSDEVEEVKQETPSIVEASVIAAEQKDIETVAVEPNEDASEAKASECETLGQTLVWLNFSHYFAVIFWFILLGAPGAVLYVFTRAMSKLDSQEARLTDIQNVAKRLHHILNWLPARITGFAILFVGHFSRALPIWLAGLVKPCADAREYLTSIAVAAETVDCPECDYMTEPFTMLKLAKRAFLFILSVIAILSIAGWI
ncbi:regulatory signaling modulator protein AmpE [Catenovulum maritimum]|uniref:Regulatory protein AmpE n=1 Tax=Catenovulum maritimum TaxID=1513271 RepID=A0A0J8GVL6_9ALTE|nr:regulatory signaling modulator protein AmpE [Catenovulum maritimum]KMT66787.1 hypothetical protein XM47_01310 [Catenovulum maritimum]